MRPWRLLAALALLAGACSGSDGASVVDDPELFDSDQPAAVEAEAPSQDFCDRANEFVTASDVRLITTPDAAVFASIDRSLAELVAGAPDAISVDVGTLRDGFAGIGDVYAAAGFDPSATLQLPPELLQSNGVAVRNLENYLIEECALDTVRATQIADITEAFGLQDEALAECLHTQLGNVANIESSSLTPELMVTEVCGTSILGLLSGDGDS